MRKSVLIWLGTVLLTMGPEGRAALQAVPPRPPAVPSAAPAVDPGELNDSLDRVLSRREYAWRLPAKKVSEEKQKGWLAGWLDSVGDALKSSVDWVEKQFERFIKWLLKRQLPEKPESPSMEFVPPRAIVYVLLGAAAFVALWAFWRQRRQRRRKVVVAEAVAGVAPDLHSEETQADQLPEERWLQLAREMMAKGEFRLSLRASYLAVLAHLGGRELLAIARHKSNWDYRRELARRAAARREIVGPFEENVMAFERSWYGRAQVTEEVLGHFASNLERIRATP